MYNLQKQTKAIKKELKNVHVESGVDGVTVVVTAEQEFVSVSIKEENWHELKNSEHGKRKLEEAFLKASNKAMKKAQEIAAAKMKTVWKELGVNQ